MRLGKDFVTYLKEHLLDAVVIGAVLALCYGKQCYSLDYFIDSEVLINTPGSFYNWLDIGRFGLVLQKILLRLSWYNPYLEGGVFLLALWGTALFAGFLFLQVEPRLHRAMTGIFSLIILIHPNFASQFHFRYQALEVVLGIWMLLLGSYGFVKWLKTGSRPAFGFSLIPLVISYGTYQSMVNMQLALYLGLFLFWIYREGEQFQTVRTYILGAAVHFLISFGTYFLIMKLFFQSGDYTSGQIQWKNIGIYQGIRNVCHYLWGLLTARGCVSGIAFYTPVYLGSGILAGAALLFLLRKKRKFWWYFWGIAGVAASPLFLSILMGTMLFNRIQLTLSLASGMLWLFACYSIGDALETMGKERVRAWSIRGGVLLGVIGLYLNAAPVMRLIYTFDVVRRADLITAECIIDDLEEIEAVHNGKPVVFIGYREAQSNNAGYHPEQADDYMVQSIFQYDYIAEPNYYYSTFRILGCFQTMGYRYAGPSRDIMPAAVEAAEGMAVWPLAGSIQEFDHFVVVRLK